MFRFPIYFSVCVFLFLNCIDHDFLCVCSMVPSYNVAVCSPSAQSCANKLLVTTIISQQSNGNEQLVITLDNKTLFTDTTGYSYNVNSPLTITVSWKNVGFIYSMQGSGVAYNSVSEVVKKQSIPSVCPNSALCCPVQGTIRQFQNDPVSYKAYAVPNPSFVYEIDINLVQGTNAQTIALTPSLQTSTNAASGVSATIQSVNVDILAIPSFIDRNYMTGPGSTFMVPQNQFCATVSSTNCLGMTLSAYYQYTKCSSTANFYEQIGSSGSLDQWSTWRSVSLASALSSKCSQVSAFTNTAANPPVEGYSCATQSDVNVLLELDATSFQLVKLYGVPFFTVRFFRFLYLILGDRISASACFRYLCICFSEHE